MKRKTLTYSAPPRNDIYVSGLRGNFGNDGFAVLCYLREMFAEKPEGVGISDDFMLDALAFDFRVDKDKLSAIIKYCVSCGLLCLDDDNVLYDKDIKDAHDKRIERRKAAAEKRKGKKASAPVSTAVVASPKAEVIQAAREPKKDVAWVANLWNDVLGDKLSKVTKLTDARKASVRQRLEDFGCKTPEEERAFVVNLLEKVKASNFLCGQNGNNWQCSFDWVFCTKGNWIKISEGNYDNKDCQPAKPVKVDPPAGIKLGYHEWFESDGKRYYEFFGKTYECTMPNARPRKDGEQWSTITNEWYIDPLNF